MLVKMVVKMAKEDKFSWSQIRRRISRSKSLTYAVKPESITMPTCVPVSNNNVTDVNANKPPTANDSKLHRIMACLFWKKKTDVVDMKKESVAKKQKLTVDRSERSRRVLKMESMKEVPTTREDSGKDSDQQSSATKQMFLPSENPTASFLSYMNPTVRRACSDVIKTSTDTNKPKSKEAFVQESRPVRTRNTNYRGQRVTGKEPIMIGGLPKPPKLPTRTQSQTHPTKKPIVVPGTMGGSDDDVGYNSDNDIDDLQEEMRRMNFSHPDLRSAHAQSTNRRRRREGSISVSEDSDTDNEVGRQIIPIRPQNPAPEEVPAERFNTQRQSSRETTPNDSEKTARKTSGGKRKSMEQVIDALFQQTQSNLDNIYQNGLEQLDEIETFRGETATPETAMRRLDEQLRESSDEDESKPNTNGAFVNRKTVSIDNKSMDETKTAKRHQEKEMLEEYTPEMDGLLTEVSVWAKDRQSWLLNPGTQDRLGGREETSTSFNDNIIEHVTRSNDDKCTEWVETQNKGSGETSGNVDNKINGVLTAPKLFRSTSKNPYSRRVSFSGDSDANQTKDLQNKNEDNINEYGSGAKSSNNNLNRNGLLIGNAPNIVHLGSLPGFGRPPPSTNDEDNFSLMYCDDRSTIDDNLSDIEQQPNYQARSPDSWMSSVVSYPNRANHTVDSHNDSFEGTIPSAHGNRDKQSSPTKRSASSPAKSHQIVRIAPKIFSPFKSIEKPKIHRPFVGESKSFSGVNKPMIRNTQLRPLPASRPPRPMEMLNQMSGLESLSTNSFEGNSSRDVYRGSRNMLNDLNAKMSGAEASPRPYSEIPLRATSLTTYDNVNESNDQPSESHRYHPRPNSETYPVKRMDKIGMGQVMATDSTKERNKYARDIVNSFQKQRLQPQSAFDEANAEGNDNSTTGNKENQHKRHTVFNNNLLKGGYTYDKHSRTRNRNVSVTSNIQENQGRPSEALTNASISQLHLSVSDSTDSVQHPGNSNNLNPAYSVAENTHGETSMPTSGKTLQSHSHGVGGKGLSSPGEVNKTAAKFKRLRSRRDQEMEWLMKDAAETEV